ncbi:MAG: M20 family metallopeptidase [Rhodospirillales bacterium]
MPLPDDPLSDSSLIALLQRFVRFPSPQTELAEADPAVTAFVRDCAAPLLRRPDTAQRFDGMGNLIVEAGPRDGPTLLFVGYAMTHPAAAMPDPFAATVIDTPAGPAVRGRGVAEQKSALAALFAAVTAALDRGPLAGRLIVALVTAGETGRHDAVECVMRAIDGTPTFAVVCIGTDNKVAVGNKGRVNLDVVVRGRATHSSAPWHGINALAGAWRILQTLEGLDLGVADHPAFGPATLTATAIESGPRAPHTVPDMVRMTFDRRLLPGETPETAFAAVARAATLDAPWTVEHVMGDVMHPNEVVLNGPLYAALRAAHAAAGIGEPTPAHLNFALDAGYFGRDGIEAVMLGPGQVDQFHSSEENVLVADLAAMAKVYFRLIEHVLAPGERRP